MQREFLKEDFKLTSWEAVESYFSELLLLEIKSGQELVDWFKKRSELEAALSEDMAWRYIKMTCDTTDEAIREQFNFFVKEIQPKIAPLSDKLNKKAAESKYIDEIAEKVGYDIMIRSLKKDIEIFREENIAIITEMQTESQKFGQISGAMMVKLDEKELTLQQAAVELQSIDREHRQKVYKLISERRLADKDKLDDLFTKLIELRHKAGINAGFKNYRDYMFKSMGRFDYTPQDCFNFHESIEASVVPMLNDLAYTRKESLGLDTLKPWDKAVDIENRSPLKPFSTVEELISKTIECFTKIDPYLGNCLTTMKEMGHLDLDSRKGKAPGGYNYPLDETGVPFIFMNATSTLRDLVTLMHEGGHAVHSFLTQDLEISDFKHAPSEVAELASMSMELISMDNWDLFFDNKQELVRAKREHLEQIIETLPWVAIIDKFQHWLYENPSHSIEERKEKWINIFDAFSENVTSWSGQENAKNNLWQKQLHLYEVPFYYIEYGMAQLGAIAVWKNYKENKVKGLEGYMNALKLGYTKSIPQVYEAANIKFDFSEAYIKELLDFLKKELDKLK